MTSCRGSGTWPVSDGLPLGTCCLRGGMDMPHTTARRNWREKRKAKRRAEAQRASLAAELARDGVPWKNAWGFPDHTPADAMLRMAGRR